MAQSAAQPDVKADVASSLAVSTRRFVDGLARRCLGHLLEGFKVSQPVDYFKLADELGIQRRRVYDIINVLEGMRLVAKSSKGRLFCS
jgi:predicted transcriptional regulator